MADLLLWNKRIDKGMTLRELADATGISRTTLDRYENGDVSPQLDQIEIIARYLDCGIVDLIQSDILYKCKKNL